ncbi:MAG TPA: M48 family peptidase, partial [Acetobacteraceae bacterium]|nr:M48 family peptidase [Acetobacteraceae bacterium]
MTALPDSIPLPDGLAPVTWRRSARARRISLRIEPRAGGVIVTLPARASAAAGRALLMTHT